MITYVFCTDDLEYRTIAAKVRLDARYPFDYRDMLH